MLAEYLQASELANITIHNMSRKFYFDSEYFTSSEIVFDIHFNLKAFPDISAEWYLLIYLIIKHLISICKC